MRKISDKLLTAEHRQRINQAIADLEKQTSCEVVAAVIDRCGDYPEIKSRYALLGGLLAMLLLPLISFGDTDLYEWFGDNLYLYLGTGLIAWLIVYAVLHASRSILARLITARTAYSNTWSMAEHIFVSRKLGRTRDANGILICAFLLERKALLYGDRAINEHLTQVDWNEALDLLLAGMRSGSGDAVCTGFVNAIQKLTSVLQDKFPIKPDDTNELSNDVIVL